MHSLSLTLLALLPLISAQTSTVSLFMPEADPGQSLVASIAGSDSTATTYVIQCANPTTASPSSFSSSPSSSTEDSDDSDDSDLDDSDGTGECGFPVAVTQTQGPSTMALTYSYSTFTAAMSCKLTGTTRAVCTESQNVPSAEPSDYVSADVSMTDGDQSGPQTATLEASEITFMPVVVTAGGKGVQKPLQTTAASAGKTTTARASKTNASAAAKSTGGVGGRMDLVGFGAGVGAAAVGVVAAML